MIDTPGITADRVRLDPDRAGRLLDAIGTRTDEMPLAFWASVAPRCATGSAVRIRLRRPLMFGDELSFVEQTRLLAGGREVWVQQCHVESQLCVETVTYAAPLGTPGTDLRSTAAMLVDGPVDASTVFDVLARPGSVPNRLAVLLLVAHLGRLHSPALVALHADFHAEVHVDSAELAVEYAAIAPSRAGFRIGVRGGPALVCGELWSGCGPSGRPR